MVKRWRIGVRTEREDKDMTKLRTYLLAGAALIGASALGAAQAATWTVGNWYQYAGNSQYYSVQAITGNTNGWLIANTQAMGLTPKRMDTLVS